MNTLPLYKLLVLLLFSSASFCQTGTFSFNRLSTLQGLSQGHVNDIKKDANGFMWFGTDGGLNKYDGYNFIVYKNSIQKPGSISNDVVLKIMEDSGSILWLATGSSLDQFDTKKETFIHYRPGKDIIVNDLLADNKNNIWLGTTEGLFSFNKNTHVFKEYTHQPGHTNSLSNNHVYRIVQDNSGMIWIATKDGLNRFDPINETFTVYKKDAPNSVGLQTNWIRCLYKDRVGSIWVGTIGSGIARYDEATKTFTGYRKNPADKNSLIHNDVLCFAEDQQNNLWIGTENGGISIFNRKAMEFSAVVNDASDPESLSNNSVYCIYKDNVGNMWAGTWSGGANFLSVNGKKFRRCMEVPGNPNSLNNQYILSIVAGDNHDVWIGTDGGGLNRYNTLTDRFTHYTNTPRATSPVNSNHVIALIKNGDGTLALGNHRGGVDIFDTRFAKVVRHISIINNEDNKFEISVNCLYKDRDGNLWVGTWGGGVYVFDAAYKLKVRYAHSNTNSNSINSDFINCFLQRKNGDMWIGTDNGVNRLQFEGEKFTSFVHSIADKSSVSHNETSMIHEDKKGRLWISSSGGLDLFDSQNKKVVSYTADDGLPSSMIQAIEEDSHGILWLGTSNGIAAFDPATKKITNYTTEDGLQGPEFKNNCSYQGNDGYMYFGGNQGFNYFHPDSIKNNKAIPPVFITAFSILNKIQHPGDENSVLKQVITATNEISISYKQNVISFEFAALNYISSGKNQYAYKMEGFDDDWIYCGTNRSATYTNLDAGSYTFRVKGCNNDGLWNEVGTAVKLVITPPFWKTTWFILLVILSVIALTLAVFSYRVKLIERQKTLLEEQVKKQTEQLINLNKEEKNARLEAEASKALADEANKKLQISNQEMEQFAYVASHDLKEPLRTISGLIQLLQKKYKGKLEGDGDKYLTFIAESAERMKVLIHDLLEFSSIGSHATLSDINTGGLLTTIAGDIGAAIKESNCTVNFNELPAIRGYATEVKLLFQNLLVNAIKFRRKDVPPVINITGADMGDHWQFSVADNGIGIPPQFREKIFKIFQRLHTRTEYEGSGIGLSHCSKIVAIHNGKLWVESTEGEGSTFYFTIAKKI